MADWTREQQLVALRLYKTEPFGRLHKTNRRIVALAHEIGRTPSALAMKACNFASLDPTFRNTGRKGLSGASVADGALWAEFSARHDALVDEMETLVEPVLATLPRPLPSGRDEVTATVKVRRHQRFFREETLSAYGGRCALSALDVPELLTASHIIPWAESKEHRSDPTNGILLNALLDRAFDRGMIGFDATFRVICSPVLKKTKDDSRRFILEFDRCELRMPERTPPDAKALQWHREKWNLS